MRGPHIAVAGLALLALLLAGCAQGPGHTRAAGTAGRHGSRRDHRRRGLAVQSRGRRRGRRADRHDGGVDGRRGHRLRPGELGLLRRPPPCEPCPPCNRCDACPPQPCPRQGMVRYGPPAAPPPGLLLRGPVLTRPARRPAG